MKDLRTFFMEEALEGQRFQARFNFGESGHAPRTVGDLLRGSGVDPAQAFSTFESMLLRDSPNWGRPDLRARVAALHPGATPDEVLVTTGTSEALFLLFRALRPRKVALIWPAFQLLYELPAALGAEIIRLPVSFSPGGEPQWDLDAWVGILERARPDICVFNHPHNPTGLCFEPRALESIARACAEIGTTLIGDEHYRFLADPSAPLGPTLFRYRDEIPGLKVFITGSFIKCLGVPGLRIGWCVGDPGVLATMQNEKNYTTHTVSPVSEWLSTVALADLESALFTGARAQWTENRIALGRLLAESDALWGAVPRGGLVSCVFAGKPGARSASPLMDVEFRDRETRYFDALRGAGVFVLPLSAMEVPCDGLPPGMIGFRLGLGSPPRTFLAGLEALGSTVSRDPHR